MKKRREKVRTDTEVAREMVSIVDRYWKLFSSSTITVRTNNFLYCSAIAIDASTIEPVDNFMHDGVYSVSRVNSKYGGCVEMHRQRFCN